MSDLYRQYSNHPSPAVRDELERIRLVIIEDLIDGAEEQGQSEVNLEIEEARWLVAEVRRLRGWQAAA